MATVLTPLPLRRRVFRAVVVTGIFTWFMIAGVVVLVGGLQGLPVLTGMESIQSGGPLRDLFPILYFLWVIATAITLGYAGGYVAMHSERVMKTFGLGRTCTGIH